MDNRDFLIISIFTFLTTLVWIFFDAYHTYKTSTIPKELKIQMEPLNLNLSTKTIQQIKNRPEFFPVSNQSTPAASPINPITSPTVTATPSDH